MSLRAFLQVRRRKGLWVWFVFEQLVRLAAIKLRSGYHKDIHYALNAWAALPRNHFDSIQPLVEFRRKPGEPGIPLPLLCVRAQRHALTPQIVGSTYLIVIEIEPPRISQAVPEAHGAGVNNRSPDLFLGAVKVILCPLDFSGDTQCCA